MRAHARTHERTHMFVYKHIHEHTHAHTHNCTRTRKHTHTQKDGISHHDEQNAHRHTHAKTRPHTVAYIHTNTHEHTQRHARIHTCTNVDTYRHTHKHLHTHISQIFTNTLTVTRSCVRAHTQSSAHIRIMRMDMQWAPLLYTHCSPRRLTRTPSFSSADDPMTRRGALGLRGEMATPMRQGVWCLLPVVLNAVPIHTQCSDHYLRDEASWL